MLKEYTCILCPRGCGLEAEVEGQNLISLEGASCVRARAYVEQELFNPQRNISTTVLVENGDQLQASVRLSQAIPKDRIFDVMKEIKKIRVYAPLEIGQVIMDNVLGLGSNVLVTKKISERE